MGRSVVWNCKGPPLKQGHEAADYGQREKASERCRHQEQRPSGGGTHQHRQALAIAGCSSNGRASPSPDDQWGGRTGSRQGSLILRTTAGMGHAGAVSWSILMTSLRQREERQSHSRLTGVRLTIYVCGVRKYRNVIQGWPAPYGLLTRVKDIWPRHRCGAVDC